MRPDPDGDEPARTWASYYVQYFHRRMGRALASGRVKLPNVMFVYNTDDNAPRFGAPDRNLPVPLLSLVKSAGLTDGDDLDVLVPQMFQVHNSHYTTPWHLKTDRAFFRGIGFCSDQWRARYPACPDPCARTFLSYLSERDRQAGNASALDVGLVETWKHRDPTPSKSCLPYDLPVLDRVPLGNHSSYKWLLQMEGITASNRLGLLMLVNSVVVMQRSYWLEYFYRSVKPWVHYVPFWNSTAPDGRPLGMDDVYGTLDELRRLDRERPEALQRIVAAANEFAVRYLTPYGRALYYQSALSAYKSLFPDMDSFVESFVGRMRAAGWRI
ncbi:hypothetical protein GPECTOR_55g318 [Gonium pectorale]|uniref:Glycosyl transferase CAP10 domain-containing protein n=1 Tax=Gonium pectorale TaxID=33097 RepID=A0A150G6D9_GONPE|nr:hypothetical protein GPECTOR_55g318 [Gonium pectorale]|eukprot:KXZ45412.1 hypothetical protein GPECTOR_55g318 [Gonium pectorale]